MKKNLLLFVAFFLILSCGAKKSKSLLSSGKYDEAIEKSIGALKGNKDKKSKQDFVLVLEDAYAKAKERDLRQIDLLLKDANPENLETVFTTYHSLNNRQEKIRPLLPLKVIAENRNANFVFDDYSEEIVNSKTALSKYLYTKAKTLLSAAGTANARAAFGELTYLEQISPNYKDVRKLIEEAQFKGTDFVSVYLKNESNLMIPKRLESEMLDFSTSGLNDKWTVYHHNAQKGIDYAYAIAVNIRQINISPEQVKEKEFVREKQVKVGTKKLLDARGNVIKDSLGRVIMVDNMKMVKATVFEYRQFKSVQVAAKVDYINLQNNQLLQSFPIASEFIFENIYARVKGDKRALDQEYQLHADRHAVPFPNNEQMVYDTGEDLKAKLKSILSRNRITR